MKRPTPDQPATEPPHKRARYGDDTSNPTLSDPDDCFKHDHNGRATALTKYGHARLRHAVRHHRHQTVHSILNYADGVGVADIKLLERYDRHADGYLTYTAKVNAPEMAVVLMMNGSIRRRDRKHGSPACMAAIKRGNFAVLEAILAGHNGTLPQQVIGALWNYACIQMRIKHARHIEEAAPKGARLRVNTASIVAATWNNYPALLDYMLDTPHSTAPPDELLVEHVLANDGFCTAECLEIFLAKYGENDDFVGRDNAILKWCIRRGDRAAVAMILGRKGVLAAAQEDGPTHCDVPAALAPAAPVV